jgi:hypothetical protein
VIWINFGVAPIKAYALNVTQPINSESKTAQTQSRLLGWMAGRFEKLAGKILSLEIEANFEKSDGNIFLAGNLSQFLVLNCTEGGLGT